MDVVSARRTPPKFLEGLTQNQTLAIRSVVAFILLAAAHFYGVSLRFRLGTRTCERCQRTASDKGYRSDNRDHTTAGCHRHRHRQYLRSTPHALATHPAPTT